jgi:hypothetical protein
MSIVFGALCLLAVGAWLSYVYCQRAGLQVLFALGCGAVLGIAAIIAVTLMVDVDPARYANPLGRTFSVLVAGLVLSAIMRLLAALFSRAVRASIAAHEVAHALWFGAAISIGAFTYLYQVDLGSFLASPNPWAIRGLQRRRCQGRTVAEWLPLLRTDTNSTEHPLRIVRVIYNEEPECDAVEVPLSWDLLRKYGLFELDLPYKDYKPEREDSLIGRHAKLYLHINGHGPETDLCWRATNGNCLLPYYHRILKPGTNEIEVEFIMSALYGGISATGPRTQVELDTRGLVPVMNDTMWEKLGSAMYRLRDLRPKWRIKDIASGFIREWDGDWFDDFCRFHEYANIEWVEIKVTSTEQDAAVVNALRALHVPGEKTEHGYRVFGYAEPGKLVNYIE